LLLVVLASARAVALVHFSYEVRPAEVLIGYPGIAVVAGAIYRAMSPYARRWVISRVSRVLDSQRLLGILLIAAPLSVLLVLCIGTARVEWLGPESLKLRIDGQERTINGVVNAEGRREYLFILPTWQSRTASVDAFQFTLAPEVLAQQIVSIPFYVTGGQQPEHLQIESALDLAIFQQTSREYIRRAEAYLHPLSEKDDDAVTRLRLIKDVLRSSLIEAARDELPLALLDHFGGRFPNDPWLPVLAGVVNIGQPREATVAPLNERQDTSRFPRAASRQFLRGVLLLRMSQQVPVPDRSTEGVLRTLDSAREAFARSVELSKEVDSAEYQSVAAAASQVFQGITLYYRGDMDASIETLSTALKMTDAARPLRARAANGVGYISFLRGDFARADRMFRQSLMEDRGFSMAAINQGYLLLATGRYAASRQHFSRLLQPDRADELQPRDAILAQLGLAHALDEIDDNNEQVDSVQQYRQVLRKQRLATHEEIEDPQLARAYVYAAVGENVYLLNRDYYALEPFALAMFGLSCTTACTARTSGTILGSREQLLDRLAELVPMAKSVAERHAIVRDAQQGFLARSSSVSSGKCVCTD
jgi:tetratricopeptide (TPR) repeat protein